MAASHASSIPLLYPEAMLFHSFSWNPKKDEFICGVILISLWKLSADAYSMGFTGSEDHMTYRLKKSSLLCSTDPL